mgnify:CR=1 FL=1
MQTLPQQKIYAQKILRDYLKNSGVKKKITAKFQLQIPAPDCTMAERTRKKLGISKLDHLMALRCLTEFEKNELVDQFIKGLENERQN